MIEIIIKSFTVASLFDTLDLNGDPIHEEIMDAAKSVPGLAEFCKQLDDSQLPVLVEYARKEAAELLALLRAAAA